VLGFSAQPLGA